LTTKLIFLFKESFRGILRTKVSSFIASLTITISLVSLSILLFVYNNIYSFQNSIRENYQIEVFFEDINLDTSLNIFNNSLMYLDGVKEGKFINKDTAKEKFYVYFNEDINSIFGTNPLPESATLTLENNFQNSESILEIVSQIEKIDGIESIYYKEELIAKLDTLINNSMILFVFFSLIIFFISIVIISNTIHLTIYARKETIDTLELLGASKIFIRIPYLIEGLLYGVIGSFISIIILSFINGLIPLLGAILHYDLVLFDNIISINFVFGILMGYIGSYSSINKYI
tara:strand:+ start:629 stop:1492 length:864 start_codon:yes stop_codon:yes gene_type:complete